MIFPTRVTWRGSVPSRGDAPALIQGPGDVVLVSRGGQERWLVFRCPSGCGDELPINLDPRTGAAWRLYNPGPTVSVYPSVWRESGCRAHFIVSRGRLWGLSRDRDIWHSPDLDESIISTVRSHLTGTFRHYYDVAVSSGLEPWETLGACSLLVRRHEAVEGVGKSRDCFRRPTQ